MWILDLDNEVVNHLLAIMTSLLFLMYFGFRWTWAHYHPSAIGNRLKHHLQRNRQRTVKRVMRLYGLTHAEAAVLLLIIAHGKDITPYDIWSYENKLNQVAIGYLVGRLQMKQLVTNSLGDKITYHAQYNVVLNIAKQILFRR